jgi:hypothetical protein
MLHREKQCQHPQRNGDIGAKENSSSTGANPYQSTPVANVDIGDVGLNEDDNWDTGAI